MGSDDPGSTEADGGVYVGPGATHDQLVAKQQLIDDIHAALLGLRKTHGALTRQKFARFPVLVRACGGDDLVDAYRVFRRELEALQGRGRNLAAAVISLTAPADTVLDRLQIAADQTSGADWRDQRTARRWSDAGLHILADHLAYQSLTQGRLGRELLNLLLEGSPSAGMTLTVDQVSLKELPTPRAQVSLWLVADEETQHPLPADDYELRWGRSTNEHYTMHRATIHLHPAAFRHDDASGSCLTIAIAGVDSPMRHVVAEDNSTHDDTWRIAWSSYRTVASLTITVNSAEPPDQRPGRL